MRRSYDKQIFYQALCWAVLLNIINVRQSHSFEVCSRRAGDHDHRLQQGMFQLDKGKKSFMVRSVICGMDMDAQRGVGITIPGLVKIHLGKIMSKMNPTLKLSLLWEEALTRSPPQGLTTQIFLWFLWDNIYVCVYIYTHTYKWWRMYCLMSCYWHSFSRC